MSLYILDRVLIAVLSLSLYVAQSPLLPVASLSPLSSIAGRQHRRLPFSLSLLLCRGFVGVFGRGSSVSSVAGRCRRSRVVGVVGRGSSLSSVAGRRCRRPRVVVVGGCGSSLLAVAGPLSLAPVMDCRYCWLQVCLCSPLS